MTATVQKVALGICGILLALTSTSCKGSTTSGRIDYDTPIGSGSAEFEHKAGPPKETHYKANGTSGECFRVRWTDAYGAPVSTEIVELDANGEVSGRVPDGATDFRFSTAKCPPPKTRGVHKQMYDPFGWSQGPTGSQRIEIGGPQEYVITGGPIDPSMAPDELHLTYGFNVIAHSFEEADERIAPILAGGPGTPIPPGVQVFLWSSMEASVGGGRFTQAQTGSWEDWSFNFNNGAFSADLYNNSVTYGLGEWSVVETVVPLSAFDVSMTPGAHTSNHGEVSYRTTAMSGSATVQYQYLVN